MFKKDELSGQGEGATIIAEGVKVEGNFASKGDILVEGMLKGSLKTEKDLKVGEKAKIVADIVASNAVIAGDIQGTMRVLGKLELLPTSKFSGDVEAKILIVSAGACLNGKCVMGADAAEPSSSIKSRNGNGKVKENE